MKRISAVLTAAAMCVLLLAGVAGASESQQQRLTEIDQQTAALTAEEKQLQAENNADGVNKMLILAGTIVSTSPKFIVEGGGMTMQALLGYGTPYYIINDPQDGVQMLYSYTGLHEVKGVTQITINGYKYSATILGPLPPATAARNKRIKAIDSELEALSKERQTLLEQLEQEEQVQRDALSSYSSDANTDIIFQIGNPYYVAYGSSAMIEDGNYAACPVIENDSTLVPIRAVMDAVGGETIWDPDKSIQLTLASTRITLQIDSPSATVNDKSLNMPVAPKLINGKTMIPLRFVSEQFGMGVEWLASDQVIRLKYAKDWTEHMDRYLTDNADGSKHFIDPVLSVQYDVPAGCELQASYVKDADTYVIIITKEGTEAYLGIFGGETAAEEPLTPIALSGEMSAHGIDSIYSSRTESNVSESFIRVNTTAGPVNFVTVSGQGEPVTNTDLIAPDELARETKESTARLDDFMKVTNYILDSMQVVCVG